MQEAGNLFFFFMKKRISEVPTQSAGEALEYKFINSQGLSKVGSLRITLWETFS